MWKSACVGVYQLLNYCFVFDCNYIIIWRRIRHVVMSCLKHNQWHRLRIWASCSYAITDYLSAVYITRNQGKRKRAILMFHMYCLHLGILNFVCGQNMNVSAKCVKNTALIVSHWRIRWQADTLKLRMTDKFNKHKINANNYTIMRQ